MIVSVSQSYEAIGLDFVQAARERRFDGSRLKALRDLLGGLGGLFGGLGISSIDSPDDIGALADKFGPLLAWVVKFTPTPVDDQALEWVLAAAKNPTVQQILFSLLFTSRITPADSDDELLDALQAAAGGV